MPYFHYRAIDPQQHLQTGRLFAANKRFAEQTLNAQHWVVLSLRPDWYATWRYFGRLGNLAGRRQARHEQQAFLDWCTQLKSLLGAGISLQESLCDLQTSGPTRLRNPSHTLLIHIRDGQTLAQALLSVSRLPDSPFQTRWIKLIAAGESAGHLVATLSQLVDHLAWDLQQNRYTRHQLLQPLLSGLCVLGATLFLILHLAPQVRPMLDRQPLSMSTQALFWLSDNCRQYGLAFGFAILLLIGILIAVYQTHTGIRRCLQTVGLRTPILGQLPLLHDLGLYARSLSLLQGNGIPILEAMRYSRETLADSVIKHGLSEVQHRVEGGQSLHAAFVDVEPQLHPVGWPSPVIRLIYQGERTGQLAEALKHIGEQLQQRRRALIQQQQALLQPLVTVLSGGLLAWVALALLGPFYEQLGRAW